MQVSLAQALHRSGCRHHVPTCTHGLWGTAPRCHSRWAEPSPVHGHLEGQGPIPRGGQEGRKEETPPEVSPKSEGSPTLTDPCVTSLQDLREAGASATQAVARQWMVGHVPRTPPAAFPHCRKRVCPLCTPLPLPGPGGSRLRNQCLGNLTPWSEPGRAWRLTLQSRVGEQGDCCEPGGRTPAL